MRKVNPFAKQRLESPARREFGAVVRRAWAAHTAWRGRVHGRTPQPRPERGITHRETPRSQESRIGLLEESVRRVAEYLPRSNPLELQTIALRPAGALPRGKPDQGQHSWLPHGKHYRGENIEHGRASHTTGTPPQEANSPLGPREDASPTAVSLSPSGTLPESPRRKNFWPRIKSPRSPREDQWSRRNLCAEPHHGPRAPRYK